MIQKVLGSSLLLKMLEFDLYRVISVEYVQKVSFLIRFLNRSSCLVLASQIDLTSEQVEVVAGE